MLTLDYLMPVVPIPRTGMKPIHDIRRSNLNLLIEQLGSVQALATKVGRSHAQISQLRNKTAHSTTGRLRTIGDKLARAIEQEVGLNEGWMDLDRENDSPSLDLATAPSPRANSIAARIDALTGQRRARAVALIDLTLRTIEAEEREAHQAQAGAPAQHAQKQPLGR